MGGAARLIRLVLVAVFLLARAALGVSANAGPLPVTTHVQAGQTTTHAVLPSMGDPCCPERAMPCDCGPGLCGTALAVLPTTPSLGPVLAVTIAFLPDLAPAASGIRASPALPPPRI